MKVDMFSEHILQGMHMMMKIIRTIIWPPELFGDAIVR